eukprot:4844678-Prymnesium_polylepis.1
MWGWAHSAQEAYARSCVAPVPAYSAKKPPDFGQGLRLIGMYSHDKLYGDKMPALDQECALVQ